MKGIEKRMEAKLGERALEGNLRQLTLSEGKIDFCSNDYLGLSKNRVLQTQIKKAYDNIPLNGSTGSRLISGNSQYALQLEQFLAQLFEAEAALLFNSGYSANTAILSTVPQKGDIIIYDEYIHASLKEGARLSFANRFTFRHNDLYDLERKLQKATGEVFIVAESVYSMDGDFAPLASLIGLCQQYNAYLIWDEAHSTGMWGTSGSGLACASGLHPKIFARIHTFGKAMGGHGACIVGSRILINYLINFARSFIYTTALPFHGLVTIRESFQYLSNHPEETDAIHHTIAFFKKVLASYPGIQEKFHESQSPIQVVKIGGNEKTKAVATRVQKAGFDVRPILSPTVKEGEERLRICLHTYNTTDEMNNLLLCLTKAMEEVK